MQLFYDHRKASKRTNVGYYVQDNSNLVLVKDCCSGAMLAWGWCKKSGSGARIVVLVQRCRGAGARNLVLVQEVWFL